MCLDGMFNSGLSGYVVLYETRHECLSNIRENRIDLIIYYLNVFLSPFGFLRLTKYQFY